MNDEKESLLQLEPQHFQLIISLFLLLLCLFLFCFYCLFVRTDMVKEATPINIGPWLFLKMQFLFFLIIHLIESYVATKVAPRVSEFRVLRAAALTLQYADPRYSLCLPYRPTHAFLYMLICPVKNFQKIRPVAVPSANEILSHGSCHFHASKC